jgi:tetratricopeptide (TPR) repeat protein
MPSGFPLKALLDRLFISPAEELPALFVRSVEQLVDCDHQVRQQFAEEFCERAAPLESAKPLLFCYASLTEAFVAFYSEHYDRSLPLLTKTHELFIRAGDECGAAVCRILQGSTYRTFGNADLGLPALWEGYHALKDAPAFIFFFLAAGITVAGMLCDKRQFEEAAPLFREALDLSRREKKRYWIVYALHGLARVFRSQDQLDDARHMLEEAKEEAERYGNPVSIGNSLSELGNYYFSTGEFEQAETFHRRSLELREQHGFTGGAVTSCIRLGEIRMARKQLPEAKDILEHGLTLATSIGVKLKMYQIHRLLSGIYRAGGDLEASLSHFTAYHELYVQVEEEDSARRVKNARLVFEAEQTRKENVVIRRQKEEIESKNIELQRTIDELTRARIGKRARAITLVIAVVLFVCQDFILGTALRLVHTQNYFISLGVKMGIIFSLSPINRAIENYLYRRVMGRRAAVPLSEEPAVDHVQETGPST